MAGRDFSSELFEPTAPSAGRDLSADLFGELAPAPAPKEKPAPVSKVATAPVDTNAPPAYKNRAEAIDDAINLLEEGVDREELKGAFAKLGVPWKEIVARGQQRGSEYFKRTTGPVSKGAMPPTGEIKAGEEPGLLKGTANLFKRANAGLGDTATGLLLQTGGIKPEQAGQVLAANAKRRAAAMPDSETRAQMEEIGNAKTYGEAATALATNPKATFTMLIESVATSLPAMVPAMIVGGVPGAVLAGVSSGSMEYGAVMADVLQDKGINMLDPNAISEALNNPKIMEEIKDKGAKRGLVVGGFDALTMGLAGRFLRPAQALIREGKLAGTSAKKATVAAWGKELSMQMAGGAGGEFAAQKVTGDNKPVDVLLEGLAEGISAPLEVMSNLRESGKLEKKAVIPSAEQIARSKGFLVSEGKKEPTLDEGELLKAAPPSVYRSMDDVEKDRSNEIYNQLLSQNIPADSARRIAAKRVLEERKQKIKALVVEPTDDEVQQRAKELIDGGFDPVVAMDEAQKQIIEEQKSDALAQAENQGEQNARQIIAESGGVSVPVVGQPGADTTAARTGIAKPSRVVSARPDVAGVDERAPAQPVAVDPVAFAKRSADGAIADQSSFGSLEESIGAYRDNIPDSMREQGVTDQTIIDKALAAYDEEISKQQGELTPEEQDTIQAELDELQNASPEDQAFIEDYAADQEVEEQAEDAAVKAETKKRGRPLNDEETRAVKGAERKKNRAEYTKAERQLSGVKNNLTAQLDAANEVIDEGTVENEEALKQAQEDKRAQKADVITKLLDMEQQFRGTALGKRVKAILDDRNRISQEELTKVKRGRDILSGRTPLASRGSSAKGKVNTAFNKATNASQAITVVAKTGNMFQKFLANRLRGFVSGTKFVVIEQGDEIPEDLQNNLLDWERADAMFVPDSKTIYVRGASFGENQGINNTDVLHEVLHAATNQRIGLGLLPGAKNTKLARFVNELIMLSLRAEAAYLEADIKGLIPSELKARVEATVDVDEDGRAYYGIFELPQEFLAYGMSDADFQEFLGGMKSDKPNETGFTAFARMLYNEWAKAFGRDGLSAMSDLINVTDKILDAEKTPGMRLVERGLPPLASRKKKPAPPSVVSEDEDEFGNPVRLASELAKDAAVAREKVRVSRQGEEGEGIEAMQMARDPEKVKSVLRALVTRNWQNMSQAAIKKLVALPTLTFLADWSGIKSLKDVEKQMQEMIGMSNSLQAGAQKILASMKKELNPLFRSAKQFRTDFENLVYETTIAQIDPSDPKTKQRSAEIDKLYNKVGEKGQRMYRMLKQYYENIIDLYSDLLDQQVNSIQGLAPEAKENLVKILRQTFEAGARIRPYFPLVRRGSYWLRVEEKVGKETKQAFYLFETVGERNQRASELAAERKGNVEDFMDKGTFDMGDSTATLRAATQNSSAMLTQIFDAIDQEKFDSPAAKEALKDAIYQVYLNTMPEQSFRNQFIRRKDRAGFSTDVLRNVATTASNTSMHLAKLKYSPLMRNSVSAARDAVKGRSNLTPFVEEAQRRVNVALEEPEHGIADAIAGFANKISYFWFLSSASSALIQPASIYIAGLPVLGANHNNVAGAAKELGKMVVLMNQYSVIRDNGDGTSSIAAPSLVNNTTLSEAERDAIREMSQRGVGQSSYASEVWGYQSIPTRDASTFLGKTGELGKEAADLLVGSLMHNVERLTREAVFLASYRLGIKRKLTQNEAINQAVSDVNEALANYDVTNRPRFMQRGVGKILLQFKMFPLHTALLLATNFYKMLPLLNKEGKKAAAVKFFGIYLTAGSLAGLAGIPFFSGIIGVMASLFKALQDDDEWPEEFKDMDAETWFRTVFLEEKLGDVSIGGIPVSEILDSGPLNALTGLAIAERIGLNDLFGRDTKEAKTEREALQQFMIEKAGPFASVGLTLADAYDAYSVGDYQKMIERASPSVLRNLLLADKLSKEGMKDARGQEVMPADEITNGQIIAQAIGFRPAILARMSETNFKLTGAEQRIVNERNRLMQSAKIAARKENKAGDEQLYKLVDGPITKFNNKYPEYAIEDDQLEKSLEDDLTTRAESRLGFPITEKNVRLVEPSLEVLERRIERIRSKGKGKDRSAELFKE